MRVAKDAQTRRNKAYWTETARWADLWARVAIPGLYLLALIIVFNIELTDNYLEDDKAVMFQVCFAGCCWEPSRKP